MRKVVMLCGIHVASLKLPVAANEFKSRLSVFVCKPEYSVRCNKFAFDIKSNSNFLSVTAKCIRNRPKLLSNEIDFARFALSLIHVIRANDNVPAVVCEPASDLRMKVVSAALNQLGNYIGSGHRLWLQVTGHNV